MRQPYFISISTGNNNNSRRGHLKARRMEYMIDRYSSKFEERSSRGQASLCARRVSLLLLARPDRGAPSARLDWQSETSSSRKCMSEPHGVDLAAPNERAGDWSDSLLEYECKSW